MDFDERTNQLIRELRSLGVTFPVDLDERTYQLVRELAAEKAAQLEGAKAVISPLTFIIVVAVFALCFWRYDIGAVFSIGAAILTIPAMLVGAALPIGYILGRRSVRRFKARLGREASSGASPEGPDSPDVDGENEVMTSGSDKAMQENMDYTLQLADQILRSSDTPQDAFMKAVGTLAQVIHIITPDEQREETLKSMVTMLRTYLEALDAVRDPSSPTIR